MDRHVLHPLLESGHGGIVGAVGVRHQHVVVGTPCGRRDGTHEAPFGEIARDPSPHYLTATELAGLAPRPAPSTGNGFRAEEFEQPATLASSEPEQAQPLDDPADTEPRIGTIELLDDDIVFSEPPAAVPAPAAMLSGSSETGLRDIDALPAERKLAFFA